MNEKTFSFKYLEKQLEAQDYVAAMLFVGPKGSGKLQKALEFAQAVICSQGNTAACRDCVECKLTASGNHPDLIVLDEEKSVKIDQIRDLQGKLYLKPFRAAYKVAIVNNAQLMTEESANSFLKILEEPPVNSIIILTANDRKNLLETILSRVQIINFQNDSREPLANTDELILVEPEPMSEKFKQIEKIAKDANSINRILETNETFLRRALLAKNRVGSESDEAVQKFVTHEKEEDIIRYLENIAVAREFLKSNVNGRFVLENLILNNRNQNG